MQFSFFILKTFKYFFWKTISFFFKNLEMTQIAGDGGPCSLRHYDTMPSKTNSWFTPKFLLRFSESNNSLVLLFYFVNSFGNVPLIFYFVQNGTKFFDVFLFFSAPYFSLILRWNMYWWAFYLWVLTDLVRHS